jgi:hypothetical protein
MLLWHYEYIPPYKKLLPGVDPALGWEARDQGAHGDAALLRAAAAFFEAGSQVAAGA